jgi:hypothetical protein
LFALYRENFQNLPKSGHQRVCWWGFVPGAAWSTPVLAYDMLFSVTSIFCQKFLTQVSSVFLGKSKVFLSRNRQSHHKKKFLSNQMSACFFFHLPKQCFKQNLAEAEDAATKSLRFLKEAVRKVPEVIHPILETTVLNKAY